MNTVSKAVNNGPTVSIIVPFYKTEPHIYQCIKSIVHQTCTDIEIILVDDASPDNSLQIAKKMADKDVRIKIVRHNTNLGVDMARFTGLHASSGEYVMFVDSDDYIPADAVRTLLDESEKYNADIVEGQMRRVYNRLIKITPLSRTQGHRSTGAVQEIFQIILRN